MKKVLILAYDFPPYVSVGALRPNGWYTHFKEFDCYPIVITRNWDSFKGNLEDYIAPSINQVLEKEETEKGTIIKAPFTPHLGNRMLLKYGKKRFGFLRSMVTAFFELGQYIFPIGNKRSIYLASKDYLKDNKVDVIIATGEPYVLFKYASKLSKEFKAPWIADYRDTWSGSRNRSKGVVLKKYFQYLERKYNKTTSLITTVSDVVFQKLLTHPSNRLEIVGNGYNSYLSEIERNTKQADECLTISLAGSIYKHHPIYLFLEVINSLIVENKKLKIRLNFYGVNIRNDLEQFISTKCHELKSMVTFTNKLEHKELIRKLASSNIFLLFNAYSTTGTKIFEYLALNRKILFCFNNEPKAKELFDKFYSFKVKEGMNMSMQADIIRETNSGIIVENEHHLKEVILQFLDEFQEKRKIENNSIGVEKYSRKKQVEKLAEIILELT